MGAPTSPDRADRSIVFYLAALFVAIFVAAGLYYLVPGIGHLFFQESTPTAHFKIAAVFFVLAILGLIVARLTRPSTT